MRILLSPTRKEWYIEKDDVYFSIEETPDAEIALTVLPLRVIDDAKIIDQFTFEGSATVAGIENGKMQIEFREVTGELKSKDEVGIDETCLCTVDWSERPFDDGWVSSRTQIDVENVSTYALKLFLPIVEGQPQKSLTIENKTTGDKWNYNVIRGQENLLNLVESKIDNKHEFMLHCDSEPLENTTDTRELGFVLVDEVLAA